MIIPSQGQEANISGGLCEKLIEQSFRSRGARREARTWLEAQASQIQNKVIRVLTVSEAQRRIKKLVEECIA